MESGSKNEQQMHSDLDSNEDKFQAEEEYEATNQNFIVALYHNDRVPRIWKFLIPALLIGNICMFAFDSDDGADVHLNISSGGKQLPQYNISKFSLLQSIKDMWHGSAYGLSIMVLLWSGIWPYLKLFFLLMVWVLNTQQLSFVARERIMIMLDTLGKWSLIDSYMLIMQLVAFNLHIGSEETISVIVQVAPGPSFYIFLFATLFSLILTHIILYFHRQTKQKEILRELSPRSLASENRYLKYGLLSLMVISSAFMFFGAALDSFNFTFYGLAGYLIQPHESTDYSIMSLGQQLPYKTENPNGFMIRMIQVLYFTFGLVVPQLFYILLGVLWMVPLKLQNQIKIFQWAEILNAWGNMEVVAICILACIMEIPEFTYYMIGRYCGPLNEWLKVLDDYGILNLEGHDLCFQVECTFLPGFFVFLSAALIYLISSTVIIRLCQRQLNKITELSTQNDILDDLNQDFLQQASQSMK